MRRKLTDVVVDALRRLIGRHVRQVCPPRTGFTVVGGRGLQPGVDLDNTADLLDLMERAEGAR
ncbi:MAG TPA: hypothetical protein VLE22_00435 [Bryobacteraceae bacterium]|nr:hypothetical protein [Bryobacteraceae bacterium]